MNASSPVPTLILSANGRKGTFFLDGLPVGYAGESAVVTACMAKTAHTLQFFSPPFQDTPLAVTLTLELLDDGVAITPYGAARIAYWPGNVIEIELSNALFAPVELAGPFPQILDRAVLPWPELHTATLFYENGLNVAIEGENGRLALGKRLSGHCKKGRLEVVERSGPPALLIVHGEAERPLCAAFTYESQVKLLALQESDEYKVMNDALVCVNNLGDTTGRQEELRFPLKTSAKPRRRYGYFSVERKSPENEQQAACAFLEAVKLGLEAEAMEFLSEGLRKQLPFGGLSEFLGNFAGFAVPPTALNVSEEKPILGLYSLSDESVRLFGFEVEEEGDSVLRITNIRETFV